MRRMYIRARRKLCNPINALKGKIDGETTEFQEGNRLATGSRLQIDRLADLSNCALGTERVALRPTYQSRVFARLAHSKAFLFTDPLCPSGDKSICGPFTTGHCVVPHL